MAKNEAVLPRTSYLKVMIKSCTHSMSRQFVSASKLPSSSLATIMSTLLSLSLKHFTWKPSHFSGASCRSVLVKLWNAWLTRVGKTTNRIHEFGLTPFLYMYGVCVCRRHGSYPLKYGRARTQHSKVWVMVTPHQPRKQQSCQNSNASTMAAT